MKPTTVPFFCGIALAAMSAAGFSHWWSVSQFAAAWPLEIPAPASFGPSQARDSAELATTTPAARPSSDTDQLAVLPPTSPGAREEFFEALLVEMKKLRTDNRDLLDQMAETNRDLMKLEFRVDTHSESFRPLPVSEDRIDTSFDAPGVLPPRATPVDFPFGE